MQTLKKTGSRMPRKKLYFSAVITFHARLTPVVTSPCRTSSGVWGRNQLAGVYKIRIGCRELSVQVSTDMLVVLRWSHIGDMNMYSDSPKEVHEC